MRLIELFKEYLESNKQKASKATVKNYLADIKKFISWFESKFNCEFNQDQVFPETISSFHSDISHDLSEKSAQRYLSSLRKFFDFLALNGKVKNNPFEIMEKEKKNENQDTLNLKAFKNFLYVYNSSHLTIKNYIIDIKQFFTWACKIMNVKETEIISFVNSDLINNYKEYLFSEKIFSVASINRKLSSLRKYLNWSYDQGFIKNNNLNGEIFTKEKEVISNPVKIEDLLSQVPQQAILQEIQQSKAENKKTNYSKIPPVRVVQKVYAGSQFLIELIVITPLTILTKNILYNLWKLSGKKIFTLKKEPIQNKFFTKIKAITNISKYAYAPSLISTKNYTWYQKLLFHSRFSRPEWYKKYHNIAIAHYFNWAALFIFSAIIGFGLYNSFIKGTQNSPTLASGPVAPPRILSFQGRLTDSSDNPITAATDLRFAIYNDISATGGALLWQEVQYQVTPDTDGIFSINLGTNTTIPQSLFAQNATLYLGVTVKATAELNPRQQLATVAYATNAETLQGLPPITDAGVTNNQSAVLALNASGVVSIAGTATTQFLSQSGQLTLTGKTLLLNTSSGQNTNVQIAPDGLGKIDLQKPLENSIYASNISTAKGAVEIDGLAAILATSSGQSAFTIEQDSTGPLISASVSGTAKFTVDNSGNVTAGAFSGTNLTLSGNVNSNLIPGITNTYDLGTSSLQWRNIYGQNIYTNGQLISQLFQRNSGALSPINITDDLLLGATSTTSARFAFYNVAGGTPIASISAGTNGATFLTADGNLSTTANQNITIGNSSAYNTTGNVLINPNGTGRVGIGTTIPGTAFQVSGGSFLAAGTTIGGGGSYSSSYGLTVESSANGTPSLFVQKRAAQTANVIDVGPTGSAGSYFTILSTGTSGFGSATQLGNAELVVNQPNSSGDIFTASQGATPKFTIGNNGSITDADYTTNKGILFSDSTGLFTQTAQGAANTLLHGNGTSTPTFSAVDLTQSTGDVTNTLGVGNGGTGVSTLASGAILYGNGTTTPMNTLGIGVAGTCITSNGSIPSWATCSTGGAGTNYWTLAPLGGALTVINNTLDILIGGNATTSAKFAILNNNSSVNADPVPIASISATNKTARTGLVLAADGTIQSLLNSNLTIGGTTTGSIILKPLSGSGTVTLSSSVYGSGIIHSDNLGGLTSSAVNLNSSDVTSTLAVGNGGTGLTTLAAGSIPYGNAASQFNSVAIGSNNSVLTSNGSAPVWASSLTLSAVTLSGNLTLNGQVATNIVPNTNGTLNLGSSGNPWGTVYANSFITAIGNGTSGYWSVSGNSLSPVTTFYDLLVGGTSTGSATPWQVFSNTVGVATAGTATTSGNLTFRGTTTNIKQLNGGSLNFLTSVGGDAVTTTALTITNAGNLQLGATSPTVSTVSNNTLSLLAGTGTITLGTSGTGGDIQFFSSSNKITNAGNLTLAGTISLPNDTITGIVNYAQFSNGVALGGATTYNLSTATSSLNSLNLAGNLYLPVSGGIDGYWQLASNVIAPSNLANDLAIGATATGSATPFQVFASTINTEPAGTASTSGFITYRGTAASNTVFKDLLLNDSQLGFYTSVGGDNGIGSTTPALYIKNGGNVGIGTNNPTTVLFVQAASSSATAAVQVSNGTGSSTDTQFIGFNGSTGAVGYDGATSSVFLGTNAGKNLELETGGTLGTANTRLFINQFGFTGIGTNVSSSLLGNAQLVVNQSNLSGSGDIFTASNSGVSKFTIGNDGSIKNNIVPNLNDTYNLGELGREWNNLYVKQIISPASGGIAGYWQLNSSVLAPANIWNDLAVGGTATAAATPFQVFGSTVGVATAGTATSSGNLSFRGASTKLNLLNGATFGVYNSVGGDGGVSANPALFIAGATSGNFGNVGIGTSSPISPFEVFAGTTGGNAAAIIDQRGFVANDIFTASASGTTRFTINNNGSVIATSTATTTDAFAIKDTNLTTGNLINAIAPNPSTTLTGNLINVASANHSYLDLTNQDLTINGHKNNTTISNVKKVFVYDTSKDSDGGRWTNDERAQSSSWYNETSGSTRGTTKPFPRKSILVVTSSTTSDALDIYDAKDNSLWMQFNKVNSATEQMVGAGTAPGSSVFALNGRIYYSNSASNGGVYVIDFKQDTSYKYDGSATYFNANTNVTANIKNRNSTVTYTITPNATAKLASGNVNDVYANIVNGNTYLAVATAGGTNGSVTLVNESNKALIANYGPASINSAQVWLTSVGTLYATIANAATPANYALKIKYKAQNGSGNNTLFDEIYAYVDSTHYGASSTDTNTFGTGFFSGTNGGPASSSATFIPNTMSVTEGTSTIDGKSDTVYLGAKGSSGSLMAFQLNKGTPNAGSVKFYNTSYITEDMVGDIRGMWPLQSTFGSGLSDASQKATADLTKTNSPTFATSAVRNTGGTFAATDSLNSASANLLLSPFSTLSLSAWVHPTAKVVTNGTRAAWVSGDHNTANIIDWGFGTKGDGANANIYCWASNSTPTLTEINTTVPVTNNTWYHVAMTMDASGNLKCYVNGQLMATGSIGSGQTPTRFQIGNTQATTAINSVVGDIDEVEVTATTLTAAEISRMYQVGFRALQSHASQTIRSVAIAADGSQALTGSMNNVTAVANSLQNGQIYVGTNLGTVSVIGTDNDTISDLYSSSINTLDDTGTSWAQNNNGLQSISVGQSFGNGMLLAFGANNGGSGGVWMESNDTNLKDWLATNYDPNGTTLNQTNLNIDSILRVTNQTSTRFDDLALNSTSSAALADVFRVDSNGNFLSRSLVNSTTGMQFQDASANTVLNLDTTNDFVGIGTSSPLTTLQVAGNASESGNLTFYGSGTAHTIPILQNGTLNFTTSVGGDAVTNSALYIGAGTATTPGAIGIGTTNPQTNLEIDSSASTTIASISATASRGDALLVLTRGSAALDRAGVEFQGNGPLGWFAGIPYNNGSSQNAFTIAQADHINGSTPEFTIRTDGSVGIGLTTPNRSLDVNGTWGGNEDSRSDADTSNTTRTETTQALSYSFLDNIGTHVGAVDDTYNITGLTNQAGSFAFISIYPFKGVPTSSTNQSCIKVQINGTTMTTGATNGLCGANDANSDQTTREHFIVMYTRAQWRVMSATLLNTDSASDLAEWIPFTGENPQPGNILSIAPTQKTTVENSQQEYDQHVAGIVTTKPNTVYGIASDTSTQMALSGRVPGMVTSLNGVINNGDSITTSPITGIGMKPSQGTNTVGKALETFDPNNQSCQDASSLKDISWPTDDGTNQNRPCFKIPVSSLDQPTQILLGTEYNLLPSDYFYVGKAMILVGVSYTDPDASLKNLKGFALLLKNGKYLVQNSSGQFTQKVIAARDAMIGNLTAGYVHAQALTVAGLIDTQKITTQSLAVATENITISGQPIHDYISNIITQILSANYNLPTTNLISPLAEVDQLHTNIISPLATDTVSINGKLDVKESASIAGNLNSNNLAVNNNATISGTLYAHNIEADNINALAEKVSSLSAQNITNVTNIFFATPSANTISTNSADLANLPSSTNSGLLTAEDSNQQIVASTSSLLSSNYYLPSTNYSDIASLSAYLSYVPNLQATTATFGQNLTSYGTTTLSDTTIGGELSVGGQLILANNSINVLGSDLEIQPLKQGGVNFEGGLIAIDTNGNLTINGNTTVKGILATNIISPLANNDLSIVLPDNSNVNDSPSSTSAALQESASKLLIKNSSGSAVLTFNNLGDIIASGTASFNKLNLNFVQPALAISDTEVAATGSAGTAQIKTHQTEVTIDDPLVTDKSLIYITPVGTSTIPYLLRQISNTSFTVGIPTQQLQNTTFNWLIVN